MHTPDYSNQTQQILEQLRLTDPARYEQYMKQKIQAELESSHEKPVPKTQEQLRQSALEKLTPEERKALGIVEKPQLTKEEKQRRRHHGKSSYLSDIASSLKLHR